MTKRLDYRSPRWALQTIAAVLLGVVGCSRPAASQPPPSRAVDAAQASTDAGSLRVTLEMHLPGADPSRYLYATVEPVEPSWRIEWCVTNTRAPCTQSERSRFALADDELFRGLLSGVLEMPRCEPLPHFPGDRTFRLGFHGVTYTDGMPSVSGQIDMRASQTCAKHLRLAAWIARRVGVL